VLCVKLEEVLGVLDVCVCVCVCVCLCVCVCERERERESVCVWFSSNPSTADQKKLTANSQ
jgi:hypothetical protein